MVNDDEAQEEWPRDQIFDPYIGKFPGFSVVSNFGLSLRAFW